jgi:arylformamidase
LCAGSSYGKLGQRNATMDYEAEYNTRRLVPGSLDILARWRAASAASYRTARMLIDEPYGPGERQRYDLFRAGDPAAPLIVFIHGGYWQLGDRKDVAFVAEPFNAAGIDVALPSYSLCPGVSVLQIVDELRACLGVLWDRTHKRPLVVGHSAGGHLTAALLATDWSRVPGVPGDLVRAGCAISGVFDLAPLIPTTINRAIGLDAASAAAASPLHWPPPGRALVAAVGSDETAEFHRQGRAIAERWRGAEYLAIAGANHYTILDELTRPDGALFGRVVSLLSDAGGDRDER